ncbi:MULTISPECIES: glycoside hydrolase family 16 protein [Methylobacterium]|uniref:glycoside hydrolase family 16 protein n=1 Tax=Methylobacterium sp. WL7 TaxID=2603900 RepID=UPI001EE33763|nr:MULTISPECIES: glycoside hydrolase family 16 protein [Methylobacterium]
MPLQLCRFKKIWGDDFNNLSVSRSNNERTKWSAHTPWNGDFGDAQFIDPVDIFADPEKNAPFTVNDGILKIRARKQDNGKWTSGLLSSADPTTAGFALMYGYFEARMKLPSGPGVWPAFWLASNSPKDDKTPSVEIDVIEYYGQFPDGFHSVWHVWDKTDPKNQRSGDIITSVPSGSLSSDFHTYGVDVTKESIVFYLDRREIGRAPTPREHTKPLMILANLALGSGWPIDKTPNPSDLLIDYIYAFAPDEQKQDATCKE